MAFDQSVSIESETFNPLPDKALLSSKVVTRKSAKDISINIDSKITKNYSRFLGGTSILIDITSGLTQARHSWRPKWPEEQRAPPLLAFKIALYLWHSKHIIIKITHSSTTRNDQSTHQKIFLFRFPRTKVHDSPWPNSSVEAKSPVFLHKIHSH